jgi:DNA-binding beta-propeller fold protein YncE
VANRNDGTLSVLDAGNGDVLRTVQLPYSAIQNQTDPVDVVAINGLVYVGDRANNQVLVLDGNSFQTIQYIPTGAGIVKLSTDARGKYLWVANDGDITINIIDLEYFVPIRTLQPPSFGLPSGVVVDPSGDSGYVTFSGQGAVVQLQASDGSATAVYTNVTSDVQFPALSFRFPSLYIPSESGDTIYELYTADLSLNGGFNVTGPYATTVSPDGQYLYITLPSSNEIRVIDISSDTLEGNSTSTPAEPQQLVHTGSLIFVTHTNSNSVSFYAVSSLAPIPVLLGTVDVGSSPESLAFSTPPNACF